MMYKSIYIKDKQFATKEELFTELKRNSDVIIDAKKSQIYKSIEKGQSIASKSMNLIKNTDATKALNLDDNYYYFAVNSTWILDSHEDLHIDGIWAQSVKMIQGKNYLVEDHEIEMGTVIARKEHIEILTMKVPFSAIGKKYNGDTEVLVYKVAKSQIKKQEIKEWIESGDSFECSVRMQYVTVLLAMDSNSPDDATEKKNYDEYINKIANKDEFEYIPYFFIIKEAKNVREASLVPFGSNHVTGILQDESKEDNEAVEDTSKNEPLKDTQTKQFFINLLN